MGVITDLRVLGAHSGFRRLFAVRLVSQGGDGLLQAGLATLFFFSPERLATTQDVAAAFAVMLLPFTVIGPWAGVFLDRWRRRQVLLMGNLLRTALALALAVVMVTAGVGPAVYVLTLLTLSVNRFLLAALSAGLPRVVPVDQLLTANAITPTLGAGAAAFGGAMGLAGGLFVPAGRARDGLVLLAAALVFATAAGLALLLHRNQLGPTERPDRPLIDELRTVWRDLVGGARYLIRRGTPALGLGVMAAHRFLYGAVFVASILISRNLLSDPRDAAAGLATFGMVLGVSAVGFALAVVVTPIVHAWLSPEEWIVVCLVLAATSQVALTLDLSRPTVLIGAAALGLAAQGAKIAVDTIVQRDTMDDMRGRAFALYDVLYNAAFVGAAALAAATLPDTGHSRVVFGCLAAGYLLVALGFRAGIVGARRRRDRSEDAVDTPAATDGAAPHDVDPVR